jgi:hypothetical protein
MSLNYGFCTVPSTNYENQFLTSVAGDSLILQTSNGSSFVSPLESLGRGPNSNSSSREYLSLRSSSLYQLEGVSPPAAFSSVSEANTPTVWRQNNGYKPPHAVSSASYEWDSHLEGK